MNSIFNIHPISDAVCGMSSNMNNNFFFSLKFQRILFQIFIYYILLLYIVLC